VDSARLFGISQAPQEIGGLKNKTGPEVSHASRPAERKAQSENETYWKRCR
jgi:hypothetical protein